MTSDTVKAKLTKIREYDDSHFEEYFQDLMTLQANSSPEAEDIDYRHSLLKKIQDGYYTFRPNAKGKKFAFIKSLIYFQLFKYLHKQIYYNDYVKTALQLHEEDIVQQKKISQNLSDKVDLLNKNLIQLQNKRKKKEKQSDQYFDDLETGRRLNALETIQKGILLNNQPIRKSMGKKIFYSQFGEDSWIIDNISVPAKGYFIDVGAADGVTFSNTYYFEKIGWNGICIEPNPENYTIAKKFREKVKNLAVSTREGKQNFLVSDDSPDWSRLVIESEKEDQDTIQVEAITLDSLFKQEGATTIDLLSIDTEGTELDVLQSLNFKKYQPRIIIVEYLNMGETQNLKDLQKFFDKKPYKLVHTTKSNLIYQYEK